MCKSLVQRFIHDWLECFHNDLDAQIIETIEYFSAVHVFQLESPLTDVDDFISEGWKLDMTMVFPEFINAFLREDCFNKIVTMETKIEGMISMMNNLIDFWRIIGS